MAIPPLLKANEEEILHPTEKMEKEFLDRVEKLEEKFLHQNEKMEKHISELNENAKNSNEILTKLLNVFISMNSSSVNQSTAKNSMVW